MAVYSQRSSFAYENYRPDPSDAENPYILEWWTADHNRLVTKTIQEYLWYWFWRIADVIAENTDEAVLDSWRSRDPQCRQRQWQTVLMYFAGAYVEKYGLTDPIREPTWKVCPLCESRFIEYSLPMPMVERFGANSLEFCSPCLEEDVLQNSGSADMGREAIVEHLKELTDVLGVVPNQGFGEGVDDFRNMDFDERLRVLRVLKEKPSVKRVRAAFGSWLQALIEAGILEDGTRRTVFGTQCVARDGHVCNSLGEKTIDDLLLRMQIEHEKEPRYPEGGYRADFKVGDVLIEYFGLKGNPEYDQKTAAKIRLCKKHKIKLVAIYPEDISSGKKLSNKLKKLLPIPRSR